jgi:hypothetical protein
MEPGLPFGLFASGGRLAGPRGGEKTDDAGFSVLEGVFECDGR